MNFRVDKVNPTSLQYAIVALVIGCFIALSTAQIFATGAVVDEPVHLSAGYSYLLSNDYRLNPEHPPLVKKLAALPLFILPAMVPGCNPSAIFRGNSQSALRAHDDWAKALLTGLPNYEFSIGHLFLFGYQNTAVQKFANIPFPSSASIGHEYFLNDADLLLRSGRLALLIFPVALAVFVFLWGKQLWGVSGGLLALLLMCFDPNMIAYGSLILTDIPSAALIFACVYFFWRFSKYATIYDAAFAALFFGLAQTAKFTAAILVPIIIVLAIMRAFARRYTATPSSVAAGESPQIENAVVEEPRHDMPRLHLAAALIAMMIVGYAMIWWQYSFRYPASANMPADIAEGSRIAATQTLERNPIQPGQLPLVSTLRNYEGLAALAKRFPQGNVNYEDKPLRWLSLFEPGELAKMTPAYPTSMLSKTLIALSNAHVLPESYIYGLAYVKEYSVFRRAYLFGELSAHNFPNYFVWTFLLKSTTIFLVLLAASIVWLAKTRKLLSFDVACLAIPAAIYFVVALLFGLNLGQRHLMPIYPFLYVLIGSLATVDLSGISTTAKKCIQAAVVALIVFGSTLVWAPFPRITSVFPDYITYFNELAGGPARGWEALLDSNLEYGQSLKFLAAWLKQHGISEPIYLCFVGGDSPVWEGIRNIQVAGGSCYEETLDPREMKPNSYLAISITKLMGLNQSPKLTKLWNSIIHDRCRYLDTVDHCILIFRVER